MKVNNDLNKYSNFNVESTRAFCQALEKKNLQGISSDGRVVTILNSKGMTRKMLEKLLGDSKFFGAMPVIEKVRTVHGNLRVRLEYQPIKSKPRHGLPKKIEKKVSLSECPLKNGLAHFLREQEAYFTQRMQQKKKIPEDRIPDLEEGLKDLSVGKDGPIDADLYRD